MIHTIETPLKPISITHEIAGYYSKKYSKSLVLELTLSPSVVHAEYMVYVNKRVILRTKSLVDAVNQYNILGV